MKLVMVDVKRRVLEVTSKDWFDVLKMDGSEKIYVRKVNSTEVEERALSDFSETQPFTFLSGMLKNRCYTARVVDKFTEPKDIEFKGAISLTQMSKSVFEGLSKGEMLCFDHEGTILNSSLSIAAFIKHTKGFVYFDGDEYSVIELVFAD